MTTTVQVHQPDPAISIVPSETPTAMVLHTEIVPVIQKQSQSLDLLRVPQSKPPQQLINKSRTSSPQLPNKLQSAPALPIASRRNSIQQDVVQKV